jgi:DNA gyrase/topoisomerase IV subunit A
MIITDLPYDVGFDDFEKLLNKYLEAEFIKDWFNYSEGENIHYEILFEKGKLKKEAGKTDVHLPNKFKLIKKVPDNQLYVLDENNKVRYFESPVELIKYFTEFRLSVYEDRKTRLLKVLNERLTSNSDMCRFIELIIKGKLKINNRPKNDIKADMKEHKLPEHLIGTPISKLTKEEYEALLKENEDIKREIEYITKTTIEEMYLNDLKNLRKEFVTEFPCEANDTDKVKQEKPVAAKTEEKKVAEPVKRKRRTKAEMPARREEVAHAEEEGVNFRYLENPVKINGDENGRVKSVTVLSYELGEPDASGRRSPVAIPGSEHDIECDAVIVALGNGSNPLMAQTTPGLTVDNKGHITVDETAETSIPHVFAGGDIVLGAATVILAMGEGRKAAASINNYLK